LAFWGSWAADLGPATPAQGPAGRGGTPAMLPTGHGDVRIWKLEGPLFGELWKQKLSSTEGAKGGQAPGGGGIILVSPVTFSRRQGPKTKKEEFVCPRCVAAPRGPVGGGPTGAGGAAGAGGEDFPQGADQVPGRRLCWRGPKAQIKKLTCPRPPRPTRPLRHVLAPRVASGGSVFLVYRCLGCLFWRHLVSRAHPEFRGACGRRTLRGGGGRGPKKKTLPDF